MATELLNRSLDLIHSKVGTVHTLEFDTTYPTKLNGFVIKIFRATANYSTGDTFSLKLAEDDILTINKVNSFQGQYTVADYFKSGSAVLCVIEVTENRLNGAIRLWDISREYSKNMDAMILDYTCNQDNDADIINGMIAALQTYDGESGDIDDDTYGIHISENMRRATRQLIIKFYGQLGLKFAHPWTNAGENLNDVRSKRLEFIHIVSNNTREITHGSQTSTVQEEDLFTYVLDFENCIIIDDAKAIINSVCSEYGITGDNWGTRAFLVGLAGDSKCSLTIRGLRFCKDYMGIVFVDGKDKLVNIENCTIVTNTFNGKIAPSIYKSYYDNNQEDDILLYIGDDNSDFDEDLDTQDYSKRYRFPMFIDNYSPTSTVNINNTDINPSNDGYSAIPHIIHNSGNMNIDSSNINFYYCIKYYDNNTFTTQSGAIYNEPRLIDDNAVEYTKYTLAAEDLTDIDSFTMRSILGSFNDFTVGDSSTPNQPGFWWKESFALPYLKRYNTPDHISYWRNINVNLSNAVKPTLTLSNSNVKHTRGMFISNLWGTITIYNSRLELVNGVTKYIPNSHSIGDVYPYYGTALYNRMIDSYGGELDIKDNTFVSNGFNIQLIGVACCKEDNVYRGASLSCINNVFYMIHSYQHIKDASVCIKAMSYDPATLGNNFSNTMGNKITIQNCNVSCEYTGSYAALINTTGMSQAETAAYQGILNMNFQYPNMRYVIAYLLIYTGLFAGQRDYKLSGDELNMEPNVVYRLTDIAGTNFIYNIGDNYVSINNCYTDRMGANVSKSPMFGIYDQSVSKNGKLDIANSDIGAWFNCVSSILLREIYETEAYRNQAFAHDVYINNTLFTNFVEYSHKVATAEKSVIIPSTYFETNQYVDINRAKFLGSDVVINTDATSKVTVDGCKFDKVKLLFNVYKDPLVITKTATAGSSNYTKDWCVASYNPLRYSGAVNRRTRTSKDELFIRDCEFSGLSYTKIKAILTDIDGNDNLIFRVGTVEYADDMYTERSCVDGCPVVINSIRKATLENNRFDNAANNVIYLGQQSMFAEYYDLFSIEPVGVVGVDNEIIARTNKAIPFFDFDLELSGNIFKSFISDKDKYNVICDTEDIDDHFIASNVLILGDTVNLDAHDNTFLMASYEGAANILTMSDRLYNNCVMPYYIHEYDTVTFDPPISPTLVIPVPDSVVEERMKTIKNDLNIQNNEFASIIFGIDQDFPGITMKNIFTWFTLLDKSEKIPVIREDTALAKIVRAVYRAFNIGIKNCNTNFTIASNIFTKSRGKNDGSEISTVGMYKKKIYKTYGGEDIILFDATKPNDNDVFSGFNLALESTRDAIGNNDVHYRVNGTIYDNIVGAYEDPTGIGLTDYVYKLDMQGLIFHNSPGGGDKPYPLAVYSDYYASMQMDLEQTIESGGITDFNVKALNVRTWSDPEYKDRSIKVYHYYEATKGAEIINPTESQKAAAILEYKYYKEGEEVLNPTPEQIPDLIEDDGHYYQKEETTADDPDVVLQEPHYYTKVKGNEIINPTEQQKLAAIVETENKDISYLEFAKDNDSNRLECDHPEWNPYSCHGYSIITATKEIYR